MRGVLSPGHGALPNKCAKASDSTPISGQLLPAARRPPRHGPHPRTVAGPSDRLAIAHASHPTTRSPSLATSCDCSPRSPPVTLRPRQIPNKIAACHNHVLPPMTMASSHAGRGVARGGADWFLPDWRCLCRGGVSRWVNPRSSSARVATLLAARFR